MAGILNAILVMAVLAVTLHIDDAHGWIFATCMLVVTASVAVRLRRPVFGVDIIAALLWFRVLEAVPGFRALKLVPEVWALVGHSFAVPVFIASIVLEAVRRRYAVGLFTPAAAVATAAIAFGIKPLGHYVTAPYDNHMPVIGAVGALFIGQMMLSYIKEEWLLRLALPVAVVVVGWLIGSMWPNVPQGRFYDVSIDQLLAFFLPSFAIPAVAAVASIEALSRQKESAASAKVQSEMELK
jgi:hypothetical protein